MSNQEMRAKNANSISRPLKSDAVSQLLTAQDVATATGLSIETLAQWRSQRRGIAYIKISRNCVRYRQCDLDDWISERIVRTDENHFDGR
jgi:predicted DNA-binding transcriptional regulator AlpA